MYVYHVGSNFVLIFYHRMFQGSHLQRGSRLEDFDVKVGDSVCVPVSLTDNQVECRPPTDKPNKNVNDTICQDDTLSTDVCIRVTYYETVSITHSQFVNYSKSEADRNCFVPPKNIIMFK